jgi:hypothetical protein
MLHQTKEIMNRTSSGEKTKPSLFNFFNSLKGPQSKTFNVQEFHNLLEENKKAEPNEKSFSHISENRNKETADNQLDTIFMSLEETTVIEYSYT